MATYRFNPSAPIPNNPFYFPLIDGLQSIAGPLVVGSGFSINYATSTISATGGGGGGGPVLVVSPITNVGTATAPVIGIQNATIGQLGAVRIGSNISVLNGVISVASGSTATPGIVQLNNTTASTSILEGLTANQGRLLQEQISALAVSSNLTLAGTFSAAISEMTTVSVDGAAAGFTIGANLPIADPAIADYFVIVSEPGSYTPPGGVIPVNAVNGDWFLCDGSVWNYLALGLDLPLATATTPGVIELATLAEVAAGTNNTKAVTPATLSDNFVNKSLLAAKGDLIAASAANVAISLPAGPDGTVLTACAAAPAGITWTGTAAPAIPCACITGKGALISGPAAADPQTLEVGSNGQLLTANNTCPLGLEWKSYSNTAIPCACVIGKGSIMSGTGAGQPLALPVGNNGQVLIVNSTATTGLQWITNPAILCNVLTGKGSILSATSTGTPADFPVGFNNQVLVACSLTPQGLCWVNNPAILCSLITGRGQIVAGSGAGAPVALPPGSDGQVLIACSSNTSGLAWITSSTNAIPCSCVISKGSLITGVTPGNPVGLAPGPDGTTLTSCPACTLGLTWAVPVTNDIPCACITQKGALISGTGAGAVVPLAPGTNNQILTINSASPTNLCWTNNTAIPCAFITGKGALVTGTAAGVPAAFGPGIDGQVLTACSSAGCGLAWSTPVAVPCSCYTGKGVILGGTGPACMTALGAGTNGQLLYANNSTTTGLCWAAPTYLPCCCYTGKGNLVTGNDAALPIVLTAGADGNVLTACSACAQGLTWLPGATNFVPCTCFTTKGTIIAGCAPNSPIPVTVGGDGCILTADAASDSGVTWAANTAIPCACLTFTPTGTARGALVVGCCPTGGPAAPATLVSGTNNQILAVNTAIPMGVEWRTPNYVPCQCYTANGTLVVGCGSSLMCALPVGSPGQVLTVGCISAGVCRPQWASPSCAVLLADCGEVILNSNGTTSHYLFGGGAGDLTPGCWFVTAWGTMASNQNSCGDFYLQSAVSTGGTFISGTASMGYQFPNTPMRQAWSMTWALQICAGTNVIQLTTTKAGGPDMCFTRNATAQKQGIF